jgi:hypothetical protein
MASSNTDSSISPVLTLKKTQAWKYETDEFEGVCEIAHDVMVVRCSFSANTNSFYDVLEIDRTIRRLLESPVSVERLAEQLADLFPSLSVTVMGRAETHGWITSTVGQRFC